ncbi:hypothetical protein [Tahibacter caeni]|uniref:hypothetical protein n=1 Tax=Tahibacter caeni TaxID=1453545 RepID=UPI002148CE2C|nr:hypothetical protein [Tahibacter caeni]
MLGTAYCQVAASQGAVAGGDGLSLELNVRTADVTILLVNNGVKRPTVEYPFRLLYGEDRSGLDISFVPKSGKTDKKILCPIIDVSPEQLPTKRMLFSGNVLGQRFSKKELRELYCLEKKPYVMTARIYYDASNESSTQYVEVVGTVDFS